MSDHDTMTVQQAIALLHRYGAVDGELHTLEDAGLFAGITREWVRQAEARCALVARELGYAWPPPKVAAKAAGKDP